MAAPVLLGSWIGRSIALICSSPMEAFCDAARLEIPAEQPHPKWFSPPRLWQSVDKHREESLYLAKPEFSDGKLDNHLKNRLFFGL